MKAKEAPEKIYLNWVNYPLEEMQVEYTRTDAFIKKTCDWLERNGIYYIGFEQGQPCVTEELIKSLKKYMEGKDEMREM